MNLFGLAASMYVPGLIKKRGLRTLFEITSRTFGSAMPPLAGLSYAQCLAHYARFTESETRKALDGGRDLDTLRRQLVQNAFLFGQHWRRRFGISSSRDVTRACRILYQCIGITCDGNDAGAFVFRTCFFSDFYSAQVCRVISGLDEGLIAGLSNGGNLTFSQRMTEGAECCRATFAPQE